ncbi:MAG: 4-alpha-glucanotransferase [Prochlorococcus sp.]
MVERSSEFVRTTGVLLHPTALPGSPVCGSFGEPARVWLQALACHGIGVWQLLPLAPPDATGSPYSSPSSFALNPWLLDGEDLVNEGFLPASVLRELPGSAPAEATCSCVDFALADLRSQRLGMALREAWSAQAVEQHFAFERWCAQQLWLEDHASFMELRRLHHGLPWWEWPVALASHKRRALNIWRAQHQEALLEHRLLQWHLDRQWQALRRLAGEFGVLLFGDLPFYVARDSADVWSHRGLFSILPGGELEIQSGVPPDYFSSTGQLWGTPVYRWCRHRWSGFNWWRSRFARQWQQVDLLRLDHFRALAAHWAVPGSDSTAEHGEWRPSPGAALLRRLRRDAGGFLPLIAEDLGVITPDVEDLRDEFDLPGMKILQFAFDGNPENPYLPENIKGHRWVVYTGTHDNPTTLGWWQQLDSEVRERVVDRLKCAVHDPGWQLLELGLATEACLVITPIQDLLHLDDAARFNIPGTVEGNWCWRMTSFDSDLDGALFGYGERGAVWGRSLESAAGLLRASANR